MSFLLSMLFLDAADSLTALREHELISAVLILALGVALGVGMICFLIVVHFMRTGRLSRQTLLGKPGPYERRLGDTAFVPSRWLAVRCAQPRAVQSALGLRKAKPCSWEEGMIVANDHRLFVSPPVGGWTLVIGHGLPDPADDVDRCFHFLLELSRKLGHVQYFNWHRVLNHHAWVQAEQGQILRAYAWAGRTLWNQGKMTRAEGELGMTCLEYWKQPSVPDFGQVDRMALNVDRVPLLAARWSIDPAAIDMRRVRETHGIAGELLRRKTV